MKKSMIIIILCTIQAACATPGKVVEAPGTLLGFGELASEITVARRDIPVGSHGQTDVDEAPGTP